MENQSSPDLLSDLPESIIENILSFLPFKDAARTCILSTKWRYKWHNPPQLVFDAEHEISFGNSLKFLITHALFRHEGPIHKFKLSDPDLESCRSTDEWFIFMSKYDVKELFIKVGFDLFWVPSHLYSCQKLTHLELFRCELCPPPLIFNGFSWLKSLILQHVKVDSKTIESLVANSRLLENLKCEYSGNSELKIRAPNLKFIYLRGHFKDICLDAPLLTEIYVALLEYGFTDEQQPKSSVCNYTKLLGSLCTLESLIAHERVIKYLSIDIESCNHFLAFHRLKVIRLCEVNFEDMKETLVVFRLITNAPNLHKLQISCCSYASEAPRTYSWDSECPQNCTFNQLRVIMMADFRGVIHEMKFVKFLLETSPVLGAMIIAINESHTNHEILNLRAELQRYQWASTNAEISFF